jgi:hypothetical protein
MLHHGKQPHQMSLFIRQFLAGKNSLVLLQPTYPPNTSPCLFPKFKQIMKGKQFETTRHYFQYDMLRCLWVIPIEHFQKCFQQWWGC